MDSRQLEYFAGPNSQVQSFQGGAHVLPSSSSLSSAIDTIQTGNQVDQSFNLTGAGSSSNPSTSVWDNASMATTQGMAGSPPTPQTGMSLETLLSQAASNTGAPSYSMNQSSSARSSMSGKRPILPTRRSKTGHERKRSKLSTDATPFDSVDYWIQFDEEGLGDIPESMDGPHSESQTKSTQLPVHRLINPTQPYEPNPITQTAPNPIMNPQDFFDDSAIENTLSDDDENFSSINLADQLSKIESKPPADIPPREGLYSTPLSWERPQPGLRMDQLIGLTPPSLNEVEQRRLIAIAMNPGSMGGLGSNLMNMNYGFNSGLNTPFGSGFGTPTAMSQATDKLPQPKSAAPSSRPAPPNRQDSTSTTTATEKDKGKAPIPKTGDRAAHNDIERKYRTNLKDKIAELKDAVPALQTITEDCDDEEPGQPGRAPKVSKGTVLTKATEYIHHLERRNKQILQQHQELSRRLQAFEQLLAAQARPTYQVPDYSRALFDPRAFC